MSLRPSWSTKWVQDRQGYTKNPCLEKPKQQKYHFLKILLCYLCVCECISVCISRQPEEVGSFLLPCRFQGSNSAHQMAWSKHLYSMNHLARPHPFWGQVVFNFPQFPQTVLSSGLLLIIYSSIYSPFPTNATGFNYVALADLELITWPGWPQKPRSTCLYLLKAGIQNPFPTQHPPGTWGLRDGTPKQQHWSLGQPNAPAQHLLSPV